MAAQISMEIIRQEVYLLLHHTLMQDDRERTALVDDIANIYGTREKLERMKSQV